ncbi:MAG: polyprenyl synthetase family protein [Pseudomonadota bacterium]
MHVDALIERTIERAVAESEAKDGPARLAGAIRHALFPGGARVRPQLCLAVAYACSGGRAPERAAGAGAAIELLHCASLVHDDLPCFDAADIRRGKPSVHVAYGEPLAVLAGDALIVMAFETLARESDERTLARLVGIVGRAVGARDGIVAGQAWESEDEINLSAYHRSKTGALFVAAATAGAAAVGGDEEAWRSLGDRLGEAYQIADDIRDAVMDAEAMGKPAGQDAANARPNAVSTLGLPGALEQLADLVEDAAQSVPDCAGGEELRALVYAQARRLTPKHLHAHLQKHLAI